MIVTCYLSIVINITLHTWVATGGLAVKTTCTQKKKKKRLDILAAYNLHSLKKNIKKNKNS
jgi:hypothetical protein